MAPTPKLELEDGFRIIDERQATERWMRSASERHDGQPISATALLETIAQARSIFAINSVVSNLGVLGGRFFHTQTCVAVFSKSLDSYFTRCMSSPLWLLKSLSNGGSEIWYYFPKKGSSNNSCNTEILLCPVCR